MGLSRWVNDHLLFLVATFAVLGIASPSFSFLSGYVGLILFFMMLGLGLTLPLKDFVKAAKVPQRILVALIAQYTVIPIIAFSLTFLIDDPGLAVGILIIGSAPSEITSALMVYLAGGDLALATAILGSSILMAPLVMPLLLTVFVGGSVAVNMFEVLEELVLIVVIPLLLGSSLRTRLPRLERYREQFASMSSIMVILLILAVASSNTRTILEPSILPLAFSLLALNLLGYLTGFTLGKALKYEGGSEIYTFTVGMKEFGVGTAVALKFFGAEAAIPSAIYGIIMLLTAPALIKILRK